MRLLLLPAVLTLLAGGALADSMPVSRAEVGRAYLRFEETFRAHPPSAEDRIRLGASFDRKTLAFFRGGLREVARGLDSLTAELRGVPIDKGPAAFALAFRMEIDPPVWVIGKTKRAEVRRGTMYDVEITPEELGTLRIQFVGPDGRGLCSFPLRTASGTGFTQFEPRDGKPGLYEYRIIGPDGISEPAARIPVLAEHPGAIRARNEKRIAKLPETIPATALSSVRARNALITATPPPGRTYAWLANPIVLAAEVDAELRALEAGENPYRGRRGDQWRLIESNGNSIPFRVFVPDSIGKRPAPLVFALHGAGADENIFFEGYGRGLVKDLAAKHGFIVVSPSTVATVRDKFGFRDLLATIESDYTIDPTRIYVLGHSLGGMVTGALARTVGDRLAACAQIAGGFGRTGETGPPILYVHAGRDKVIRSGPPKESDLVTVRRFPDEGHTFVLSRALPDVIDWLLTHSRKK